MPNNAWPLLQLYVHLAAVLCNLLAAFSLMMWQQDRRPCVYLPDDDSRIVPRGPIALAVFAACFALVALALHFSDMPR